jgi:hypothetical protein
MDPLLKIASHVEAATKAYCTLKPVSNLEKWKSHFKAEVVSTIFWLALPYAD